MNAVTSAKPHATDPQSIFKPRYGNYIGGEWVAPRSGQYFENTTPVTGKVFTEVARRSRDAFSQWTQRATTLLEPLLILLMGLIVGGVVVIMMLSITSVADIGL